MGGAWCKADRGPRRYSPKGPWNTAISRWTDHVRNVYRRPKTYHRPPRPPQKPTRSSEQRLTIGPPRLISEQSSDGWRTATLTVPPAGGGGEAPVPPPRKRRKRHERLARAAYSTGDLCGGGGGGGSELAPVAAASTLSLPDRGVLADAGSVLGLDRTGVHVDDPSAVRVEETARWSGVDEKEPTGHAEDVVESRGGVREEDKLVSKHVHGEECLEARADDESLQTGRVLGEESFEPRGVDGEDSSESSSASTIIVSPVVERSSAQEEDDGGKEENNETQPKEAEEVKDADDVIDIIIPIEKETLFSSRTVVQSNLGYVDKLSAISEASAESGFDDRAETPDSGDPAVAELNERNMDARQRTALSKAAWLRGILGEGEAVTRRGTEREDDRDVHGVEHDSLPTHAYLFDRHRKDFQEVSGRDEFVADTYPSPPPSPPNHSVLLGLLRKRSDLPEPHFEPREESIFLTNTRTNIVYKTLSQDNLTDGYEEGSDFKPPAESVSENRVDNSTILTGLAFRTPRVADSDNADCKNRSVSDLKSARAIVASGAPRDSESAPSSRKSSITDSLHEFEMSIYDMLNESRKNRDSSDEEESLKTVDAGKRTSDDYRRTT